MLAPNPTSCSLLVVIINFRTPNLVVECLRSLQSEVQKLRTAQVVIADNGSGDDSLSVLQTAIATHRWQAWATLTALDHNGGFAAGNNAVIRSALAAERPPDYVLLLNPDTVVRPDALHRLLDFLAQHPGVGIVGSRLEHPDGTPQHSAFRFHSIWSEFDQGLRLGLVSKVLSRWILTPPIAEVPVATDWLAGASMMIRRQVFEQIGLMDDKFFMYYEEVDFCLRARQAGWPCWYVPESRVVHLVGQSSGVTGEQAHQNRRPQYWFNSRTRYFRKHYPYWYAVLTDLGWLFGFSLWQIRRVLQGKPAIDPPHLLQDFWFNSALIRGSRG
ncbi:glycosyltransferase family 2 protein [Acaryochloris sp. IP29b_bin.137]|uniref:glycosyltransferase family 2 protein n=1 Tax=Acaryochloris sp. IP29b_bin.137 TaxID=2969217 RepID=UPI002612E6C2|nr:glycosyltransferase family 2 protein [Acaryochloris sp. IP29b_bin.137]